MQPSKTLILALTQHSRCLSLKMINFNNFETVFRTGSCNFPKSLFWNLLWAQPIVCPCHSGKLFSKGCSEVLLLRKIWAHTSQQCLYVLLGWLGWLFKWEGQNSFMMVGVSFTLVVLAFVVLRWKDETRFLRDCLPSFGTPWLQHMTRWPQVDVVNELCSFASSFISPRFILCVFFYFLGWGGRALCRESAPKGFMPLKCNFPFTLPCLVCICHYFGGRAGPLGGVIFLNNS